METMEKTPVRPHMLSLDDRQRLNLRGVVEVDNFNESEVVLLTQGGYLSIDGEDLHIRRLDLEQGHMIIEGFITALTYADEQAQGLQSQACFNHAGGFDFHCRRGRASHVDLLPLKRQHNPPVCRNRGALGRLTLCRRRKPPRDAVCPVGKKATAAADEHEGHAIAQGKDQKVIPLPHSPLRLEP